MAVKVRGREGGRDCMGWDVTGNVGGRDRMGWAGVGVRVFMSRFTLCRCMYGDER